MPEIKTRIYIDANNLHRRAKDLGFNIDYKKFRIWLSQKYSSHEIYLFIGFMSEQKERYEYLENCGFTLIHKEVIRAGNVIKGNCDAELVLKVTSDLYTKSFDRCILVTGDGDFGCLVQFLVENSTPLRILVPDEKLCSILLKNKNAQISFLNKHYSKFSEALSA